MIKKINIFLVLLLVFISIGAVSAADGNIDGIASDDAIQDTLSVSQDSYSSDGTLSVDESDSILTVSTHTINSANYNQYFSSKDGSLVSDKVNSGDTINLDGSFSGKSFVINKTVNIVGTSSNSMSNSIITLLGGASGSTVSNLNMHNEKDETYGIFLNSADNCVIKDCIIKNKGRASYAVCLANGANYNTVTDNDLTCYGETYTHGSRSTPALLLSGSHYNILSNNRVEVDDANGIYLSSYAGGPLLGGNSNYNLIIGNTVHYNVLPTSWAYGIQAMGSNNNITNNKIIGGYRGVSTSIGSGNIVAGNTIINLTGADYNNPGVETGGEFAIVGSTASIIKDNKIIGAKIISTGAGISAISDSIVENNWVNVTLKGKGIQAAGCNITIKNNTIFTETGSGVYEKDTSDSFGLLVDGNKITSVSAVGVLVEQYNSKSMPSDVTIINNDINTNNRYGIDVSQVEKGTDVIRNNTLADSCKNIATSAGVYDSTKPTYIYEGQTHDITPSNFAKYINDNGGLTSEVKEGDILNFKGTFSDQVIYINKGVKITGQNPLFINSTFKITSGNVLVDGISIDNKKANRVNAWGIFVNNAQGVRITNSNIKVNDPKASYAIYILESTDVDVINNVLTSEGDFLTFTLLAYASEDCNFANNTIKTIGTGEVYRYNTEICIDGNELTIDGKSYCIDGNELVIDGKSYCIDGNEVTIDGKSYCIDGNELVIDGVSYCIDGNELTIDGKSYCIDGNELVIDGVSYCIDGNELTIDGKSYCIDGNELTIDGKSYCIDGNELTIDGKSYCIDGNELTIDGKSYCIDGNELTIDGVSYCIDGNELVVDGDKFTTGNAHVIPEIYRTYGILLLYSSNNIVSGNDVTVTSNLAKTYDSTVSQNSLVGIDSYFNTHNNVFSNNIVQVSGNDNYIYGMGVLGYNTGHTAPKGQGATNNQFIQNDITVNGKYFTTGLIIGTESHNTILQKNMVNAKSGGVAYGITLETSDTTTAEDNEVTLNSQIVYGIEFTSSSGNTINNNVIDATGNIVCGMLLSNSNNNEINDNKVAAKGNGKEITVKNHDSLATDNSGLSLTKSDENSISGNNISSNIGYAVLISSSANNTITDNYLDSQKGVGNKAVSNSKNNVVLDNYKYISSASGSAISVPYLGTGELKVTANTELNGAIVKFYDADGNFIAQGNVNNGVASVKYSFDSSYVPYKYVFTAEIKKENYKSLMVNIICNVVNGKMIITVSGNSAQQGTTANINVNVVDELGNPIKGATVSFTRLNSQGKVTPMGSAKTDNNGTATFKYNVADSLEAKDHIMNVNVINVKNYDDAALDSILKVTRKPMLSGAKNYSVYYGTTVKYKVRALDDNGKAVGAGKVVKFKINGKSKNVPTDKNGYATYSVKLKAGSYVITATYEGYTVSKKITFKPTVIAKSISKKKAKTIKYTVKVLNKNGKILKNKKVTFKVKNKKYTAKTNKKGIATLTLKNFKVGKYTISSTYSGCTVKTTLTVKK